MENQIQMYELYDVWYKPFWHTKWFLLSGSIFFVMVFFSVLYFLIRRFRKKNVTEVTPWQKAIISLNNIDPKAYIDAVNHKAFYFELTTILKIYLSERYSFSLASLTDKELIQKMSSSIKLSELALSLNTVVEGAEIIKYANNDAAMEQMEYDLSICQDIVKKTIPQEKQPG